MKALLVGLLAVAIACGDSSGPGKQAASVTGIAGDNQSAPTGAPLAFPLSFTALGADGHPIQGVSVSWSVTPAGRATFSAQTSQTDANGVASTNVTVGITPGAITLQATVAGVSPVVYHATILDPCTFATVIGVGESVNAALATSDCNLNGGGWYYDFYALTLPAGQQSIRIAMRSTTFDTWVDLFNLAGQGLAFDDDSILGVAQNAQLDIILPGDTTYLIGANSFDRFTIGAYSLSAATRAGAMNGCRQVWVVRGVSVSDSITTSDCADSSATPRRYDVARIVLAAGATASVLTLSARSTAMNPTLALYQVGNNYSRTLVASNDDSLAGSNTNAFIQYALTADTALFDILIGTSASGETGVYTFEVSASTTFSPPTSGPVARGRDTWWHGVALPKRSKL